MSRLEKLVARMMGLYEDIGHDGMAEAIACRILIYLFAALFLGFVLGVVITSL